MFDVDNYRLPESLHSETPTKIRSRRRKGSFLKGPIPTNWLSQASHLGGKTLHVGIAIWFAHGFEKEHRFRLTAKWYDWLEVGPKALRESLQRLCEAGLIRLEYRPGCSPIVTILESPEGVNHEA
jgi:hypothetical protein